MLIGIFREEVDIINVGKKENKYRYRMFSKAKLIRSTV